MEMGWNTEIPGKTVSHADTTDGFKMRIKLAKSDIPIQRHYCLQNFYVLVF